MAIKGWEDLALRDVRGGVIVTVKAVPGSSRARIVGVLGDCLKVATAAPAEKGKANAAVAAILACALGVQCRAVELVSGAVSRRKGFRVAGLSSRQVRRILAGG